MLGGHKLNQKPQFLRILDSYTGRSAVLRLEQYDVDRSLGELLDKYLMRLPEQALIKSGAITPGSLASLRALQDLVYSCDDQGQLTAMYSGTAFTQNESAIHLGDKPQTTETRVGDVWTSLIDLTIDRTNVGYARNWKGFQRRRWDNEPDLFDKFVTETLEHYLGPAAAERASLLDSHQSKLDFVRVLARRIWDSEFENYSRFVDEKLMFKTGDDTVRSIAAGAGGICTEKVQALKFLTDHFGFESEYLIGGDGARDPVPTSRLRSLLNTFDFRFARRYMRYWQHAALLYSIDGVPVLVDATNGNIPFLFLTGEAAENLLGYEDKPSVKVRMVEAEEDYFYHRVSQDIPENLFFAMEGWLTDTDMVQVFENELGLYLSSNYYITPLPFRNDKEYERLAADYRAIARRAGFRCQIGPGWDFESEIGRDFVSSHSATAAKILAAKDHLLLRYNKWDLPDHDAGLVVFRLA